MKAQELRIGNYLKIIETNQDTEIYLLGIQHILECEVKGIPSNYSPIPVSPEWLEKLGFENKHIFKIKGNFSMSKHPYRDDIYHLVGYANSIIVIEYVHQLQNLFFALTGEELTEINQ